MFSSKNYLNLQSPSVKAWVEICLTVSSQPVPVSPSVKAWVEILTLHISPCLHFVAFREGVSWIVHRRLSVDARIVAFREGVSWNCSEMVAPLFSTGRLPWWRELKWLHAKIPISRRTSPSVKAWVEIHSYSSALGAEMSPYVKAWVEILFQ